MIFFEKKVEGENVKFVCQVNKCAKEFSSKSSAIRHLKSVHEAIGKEVMESKIIKNSVDKLKQIELRVKVDVTEIIDACLELIAFHSLPLCVIESEAFKKLLKPYIIALGAKGIKLTVTPEKMKEKIASTASKIKDYITAETRDKMIGLMIDIASRYNRSVLGVNLIFVFNGKTIIRTIGMHTLKASQSAKDICEVIQKNFDDFSIDIKQVNVLTTDNGKNMLKTAKLLNLIAQQSDKIIHENALLEFEQLLNLNNSDEEIDDDIFDEQYYDDLLQNIAKELRILAGFETYIYSVPCAAHGIHLIVTKAIKVCSNVETFLQRIRELSKKLRTPTYRNLLKTAGFNIPIIDVVTRWNSTYNMVNHQIYNSILKGFVKQSRLFYLFIFSQLLSIKLLKSFLDNSENVQQFNNIQNLLLNEEDWTEVDRLLSILKYFAVVTEKLQSQNITLSDFFGLWLNIDIKIKRLASTDNFAASLQSQMEFRKKDLIENPTMFAAVYMDPRYQVLLKEEQKQTAIEYLLKLYGRIQAIKHDENITRHEDVDTSLSFNEVDELIAQARCSHPNQNIENHINTPPIDIKSILSDYNDSEPTKTSIFDYWEKNKTIHRELYEIANVIFAVPPTQTSVERAFSALALILSPLRTRLSEKTLENILLIRLNKPVYKEIN